jgi:polyhydroxybutyrate depolymerase
MRVLLAAVTAALLVTLPSVRAQEVRTLEHQGIERAFILANRGITADGPKPALIALHGRRDPQEAHGTAPRLDALAAREGFVAVYPAALQGKWNYGSAPEPLSRSGDTVADDVGFVGKLIALLVAEKIADPARIYVSGVSQGGFLAYSVLCDLSDQVTGVAALLANMLDTQVAACKPARAVPTVAIAGTNDSFVPYDGWATPRYRLLSVPETLDFWRRQHGCAGQRASIMPHRVDADPTSVQVIEWTGCRTDGAVRYYRVIGGGHALPSLAPPPPGPVGRVGHRNQDFETVDEVWQFFKRFTRN